MPAKRLAIPFSSRLCGTFGCDLPDRHPGTHRVVLSCKRRSRNLSPADRESEASKVRLGSNHQALVAEWQQPHSALTIEHNGESTRLLHDHASTTAHLIAEAAAATEWRRSLWERLKGVGATLDSDEELMLLQGGKAANLETPDKKRPRRHPPVATAKEAAIATPTAPPRSSRGDLAKCGRPILRENVIGAMGATNLVLIGDGGVGR